MEEIWSNRTYAQGDDRSPPLPISSDFFFNFPRCLWQRSKIADKILVNNWIVDNSVLIVQGCNEEKCTKVKIKRPQIKIVNSYSTIFVLLFGEAKLYQIIMFHNNKIKNYIT